jgi:hypothetical protein
MRPVSWIRGPGSRSSAIFYRLRQTGRSAEETTVDVNVRAIAGVGLGGGQRRFQYGWAAGTGASEQLACEQKQRKGSKHSVGMRASRKGN